MPLATEKRSATINTFSAYLQQQMLTGKSLGESFYNVEAMFRIAVSEYWKHPLTRLILDLNSVLKDISFDYSDFRLIKLFWNWKMNAENTPWPGWVRIWLLFWKLKTSSYLPDSGFHYCSESWKHPLARLISYQIWMKPETSLSQPLWFVDCNAVLRQRTQCWKHSLVRLISAALKADWILWPSWGGAGLNLLLLTHALVNLNPL